MLYDFVSTNRDAILGRAREKLTNRPWPAVSHQELEFGVPLFLTQLCETLRLESTGTPYPATAIGDSATRHGGALLGLGFTVSQVVHDYGDICQAITEIAERENAAITAAEFHTLNRCLDTAIAEAVTEHARLTEQARSAQQIERQGELSHELRNLLNSAMLAFQTLKRGTVAINGSTGAVLGRSLLSLKDTIESTLSDIRLAANYQRRERLSMDAFLADIATAAHLQAEYRDQNFAMEPVDGGILVDADPQLLASAITNLLNNAFKFTPSGGHVILRASQSDGRVRLEIQDQCGGLPDAVAHPFKPFTERRGRDRSGLGLGLSMARKAIVAHGGDISVHNRPASGCSFVIDIPAAGDGPGAGA